MKKSLALVLAAILAFSFLSAGALPADEVLPVHAEGAIFGGSSTDSIALELKFSPAWITEGDNAAYNKDLAAFSAIVSSDTYFREKDLAKGTQNRILPDGTDSGEYSFETLLNAFGFTDIQHVESFKAKEYETDQNDSVTLTLAYLNDRSKYDCFVVAVRGCFSAGEWSSCFDPGCDSPAYEAYTGGHPEWTECANFKGMDIAANRAMEFVNDFIAAHDDAGRENCVLVTGHSRGGSIAEIIGARLEDAPEVKSCTYAFNSLPVTNSKTAQEYKTIFNIFDAGDFYSDCMPFGSEEFFRYGRTLSLPAAENSELLSAAAAMKGREDYSCADSEFFAGYGRVFGELFPDRASLCEPLTAVRTFADEVSAEAAHAECEALISAETGLGLEAYCSVSEVSEHDGGYAFEIRSCRAAFLQCIGKTLAYGQTAGDAVKSLLAENTGICSIIDMLFANYAGISGGHLLLNSYLMTQYF